MADATDAVMDLAKRRGFLWPAFEVYGGAAGFYDYGPLGATMKKRFEDLWRHVFQQSAVPVSEVSCPRVTVHEVLKASGHVDEFTDLVVKCGQGHPMRADHLVEAAGYDGTADALSPQAIDAEIAERKPKCPTCGNKKWSAAAPMNLMFNTEIGPGSGRIGYLRPETAQGIFTDFPHLLRYHRGKLPFAAIQVGGSNRNEISPRQGMLRLREFHMMEAEVFFEDTRVDFPAFADVADRKATFVPNTDESPTEMTFGDAVREGMVGNQALGYFLALTQDFLLKAGMDPKRLRFRQHLGDEMAHYANDCWDAEFHSERYGWVECVGVADRGCFDLTAHAEATGKRAIDPDSGREVPIANAAFRFPAPIDFSVPDETLDSVVRYEPVMKELGKRFGKQANEIRFRLEKRGCDSMVAAGLPGAAWPYGLDGGYVWSGETETMPAKESLWIEVEGTEPIEVPADCFQVTVFHTLHITSAYTTPSVIEPSFGVDRILYALWEHAYERGEKNGEPYTVLRLSPHVAPVQAAVLPLIGDLEDAARRVEEGLRRAGVLTTFDTSGNIGRRYARQDEVGTPVCITVDPQTLEDGTVTIRDRDTTDQVRVQIIEIMPELAKRFAL